MDGKRKCSERKNEGAERKEKGRREEKSDKGEEATLGIMSAMNFWPPNPGSTVMISIMSTKSTKGNTI